MSRKITRIIEIIISILLYGFSAYLFKKFEIVDLIQNISDPMAGGIVIMGLALFGTIVFIPCLVASALLVDAIIRKHKPKHYIDWLKK